VGNPEMKRTVEKIQITITVDKPNPMPMVLHEEVGTGTAGNKKITVSRNMSGNLLMVDIDDNGYVVDVGEIVKGLLAHEEQKA
jgi:hypothetical protein